MKRFSNFTKALVILIVFSLSGCTKEKITSLVSHDGVNIEFTNTGEGKPTIILVHGWTNTRNIWEDQISYFSEKYHVVAPDLPGHGKSGKNRSDWSIKNFGKDISMIIDELGLEEVVLVGFSMGAPVVMEAAVLQRKKLRELL